MTKVFAPYYNLKCKKGLRSDNVNAGFYKNGWLPNIIVCRRRLYKNKIPITPNVTGLSLSETNNQLTITWNANINYYTEIEYKINDGSWIKLPIQSPGVGKI